MIAGLYSRYSTDNQRHTSIEDQERAGRVLAAARGFALEDACVYADGAVSASMPIETRPGSRQLMLDAMQGRFQVLVIEALDRFSRDLVDQERMVRRLEHRGIRIIGYADGYDSSLEGREFFRQVRGSFNEQQLRDIGKKTHRGLTGQFERGFHVAGISYGYRSTIAGVDGKGEAIGHVLEIDEAAAEWVRWIFARYAESWSCQRIVAELNRLGVRSPRGRHWLVSAIYGSPAKGSGVLNNELYIGRYTWNRSQWIKDPDSRRRQRFDRPREEWMVEVRPSLRILTDEAWQAVRARMDMPRNRGGSRGKGAQPRTLFGGLLKCGICGGAVTAVSASRYGCIARKAGGPTVCAGVSALRKNVDARLLATVRDELLSPSAITEFQALVREVWAAKVREGASVDQSAGRRLAELEREIANVVDAIASVGVSEALRARLRDAEAEQTRLVAAVGLAQGNERKGAIPAVLARYKTKLLALRDVLETDADKARTGLKDILGEIRLIREPDGVYAEIESTPARLLLAAGGEALGMVAGAGFEPTTFGL